MFKRILFVIASLSCIPSLAIADWKSLGKFEEIRTSRISPAKCSFRLFITPEDYIELPLVTVINSDRSSSYLLRAQVDNLAGVHIAGDAVTKADLLKYTALSEQDKVSHLLSVDINKTSATTGVNRAFLNVMLKSAPNLILEIGPNDFNLQANCK